jgi:hypothetical protein
MFFQIISGGVWDIGSGVWGLGYPVASDWGFSGYRPGLGGVAGEKAAGGGGCHGIVTKIFGVTSGKSVLADGHRWQWGVLPRR